MKIAYRLWYVKRDDFGAITEAGVRFSEGTEVSQQEVIRINTVDTALVDIIRFRPTKRLSIDELSFLSGRIGAISELDGSHAVVYNIEHFGNISTDDALITFLNGEVAKDPIRKSINAQKNTLVR